MTWLELLNQSIDILRERNIESAVTDAEVIMAHALDVERYRIRSFGETELTSLQEETIQDMITRRGNHEPVAYITGVKEFYGLPFTVNPQVLIPRPETELLVDMAIYHIPYNGSFLDLGTGSGAIALSVKKNRSDSSVTATDVSSSALDVARGNASFLLRDTTVEFLEGDLFGPVQGRTFNVIASNPPYIGKSEAGSLAPDLSFEPELALFSGDDGMDHLEKIVRQAGSYLEPGGVLLLETGYAMKEGMEALATEAGFSFSMLSDYSGHDRLAMLRK